MLSCAHSVGVLYGSCVFEKQTRLDIQKPENRNIEFADPWQEKKHIATVSSGANERYRSSVAKML